MSWIQSDLTKSVSKSIYAPPISNSYQQRMDYITSLGGANWVRQMLGEQLMVLPHLELFNRRIKQC